MKKQLLLFIALFSISFCFVQCPAPVMLAAFNITSTGATVAWTDTGTANVWETLILPSGAPAPTAATPGDIASSNPFVFSGLNCGTAYSFYVRSVCSATEKSTWSGPFSFQTFGCNGGLGYPNDMSSCNENGQACFNFSGNTAMVLNGNDPLDYTITYHTTQADANAGTNAIANSENYCIAAVGTGTPIFMRVFNNATSDFTTDDFFVFSQETIAGTLQLSAMSQCDEDGDGSVYFNLTDAGALLNTANPLAFYTSQEDALLEADVIPNPDSYMLDVNMTQHIFIRENVPGNCDVITTLVLNSIANCNTAIYCAAANSLCNSIGVPFSNTVNIENVEAGNDYDCLITQPNPTWFYIPISTPGTINLQIAQVASANNLGLDVDYICYGPFANPTTPCSGLLTSNNIVSCSYSTTAVETLTIPNAQSGQYYLIMVTNFGNQPGTITISQTGGSGDIDCTGLRLNAFLDANSNGLKDSGESNFPLGNFTYERNGDGNVHNIIAPSGIHNIYDINAANSYDVAYAIDPAYAANYALTTSAYSNISVVPGGRMQPYLFPVTVMQSYNDLAVNIIPANAPRPGFTYQEIVRYSNLGSQTVSGTVSFTKPAVTGTMTVSQTGTVFSATGFTYNFTNLLPFESREIVVTMQVPVIPTVQLNDLLTSTANIIPLTDDVASENNESTSAQIVIGSYDPNDKMESRGEYILFSDFTNQDYLYYTIRFENSGTASAINVKITDALDPKLDETSIKMVDASHENYVLDRVGNMLTWRFDNILLPAVSQSPAGGKGFVHFKVKPKPGFAIGDIIPNTAAIYFDFNPAIITNTFYTHFMSTLATNQSLANGFAFYPNPAGSQVTVSLNGNSGSIASIAIYDMLGKTIMAKKPATAGTSDVLDVSAISSGIYFLEVTTGTNAKTVKKLIIE